MKKRGFIFGALAMAIVLVIVFFMQGEEEKVTGMWKNATYTHDTQLGKGERILYLDVEAEEKKITFTIHTNKETVGEALLEHNIVDGEKGEYGLYVKKVNGMEADYDKTKTYWAFYKDGESMPTGISGAKFSDKEHFELVCTK